MKEVDTNCSQMRENGRWEGDDIELHHLSLAVISFLKKNFYMEGRNIEMVIEDVHAGEREEVMAHAPEEVGAKSEGLPFGMR